VCDAGVGRSGGGWAGGPEACRGWNVGTGPAGGADGAGYTGGAGYADGDGYAEGATPGA